MRIAVIQHIPEDGPGYLLHTLSDYGFGCEIVFARDLPEGGIDADGYVLLGGSYSANENFPGRADLLRVASSAIREGKPILGVCLGAQLLALSMDADVYDLPTAEIGWHAVYPDSLRYLPGELSCFQFHRQQFSIPTGCSAIGHSAMCQNQGFAGHKVMGLQFHPEKTRSCLHKMRRLFPSAVDFEKSIEVPDSNFLGMHGFLERAVVSVFL